MTMAHKLNVGEGQEMRKGQGPHVKLLDFVPGEPQRARKGGSDTVAHMCC